MVDKIVIDGRHSVSETPRRGQFGPFGSNIFPVSVLLLFLLFMWPSLCLFLQSMVLCICNNTFLSLDFVRLVLLPLVVLVSYPQFSCIRYSG